MQLAVSELPDDMQVSPGAAESDECGSGDHPDDTASVNVWNLRAFKDSLGAETIGKIEAAALLYHHAPWRARPPSCWAEMR